MTKYKRARLEVRVHAKSITSGTITIRMRNVSPYGSTSFPDTTSDTTLTANSINVGEMGVKMMADAAAMEVGPNIEIAVVASAKNAATDPLQARLSIDVELWET